jgi:hypothetical protein
MELFMAGGNYAASEVAFPKGFPDVVQAEIAAARQDDVSALHWMTVRFWRDRTRNPVVTPASPCTTLPSCARRQSPVRTVGGAQPSDSERDIRLGLSARGG